jgi:uncharacterized protein (TIGR03089 family)
VSASASAQQSVQELVRRMVAADPGRPRVTWYGPDGERVELSARTLDNWVAKTANLLVDEFDAGPGVLVDVRLPPHWRTVTWLLATWVAGACAAVPEDPSHDADVVVTADPAAALAEGLDPVSIVAVALPALATSFGAGLPRGVLDGSAEVRTRGDVFVPLGPARPGEPALTVAGSSPLTHGELLAVAGWAAAAAGLAPGDRVLVPVRAGQDLDAVGAVLAPLAVDGSVVLASPALGEAELSRVAAQERVTARL